MVASRVVVRWVFFIQDLVNRLTSKVIQHDISGCVFKVVCWQNMSYGITLRNEERTRSIEDTNWLQFLGLGGPGMANVRLFD